MDAEEIKKQNLKISREGSWLCAIFQEQKLNKDDKQKILRCLFKKLHDENVKNKMEQDLCHC